MSKMIWRWLLVVGAVMLAVVKAMRTLNSPPLPDPVLQRPIELGTEIAPRKRRHVAWLIVHTLMVIGSAVALVFLYFDATRVSDYPAQPVNPGDIRVYFDAPGVPAVLEVDVSDKDDGLINATVSVDSSYEPENLGFRLVITGLLAREPELPGMREPDKHGCWQSIYVVQDENLVSCDLVKAAANGIPGNPKDTEQLVVSAQLKRNDAGAMFTQVTLYSDRSFSTSAGKRKYFALPNIGTTFLPTSIKLSPLDMGVDAEVFVPSQLDVVVDYRDLAPQEKVDSVAPDLDQSGKLSWIEIDASMVKPWGSIVDITLEDAGQRRLYFIGVIVGLLAAFVPMSISSAWKALTRIRGAWTNDRSKA